MMKRDELYQAIKNLRQNEKKSYQKISKILNLQYPELKLSPPSVRRLFLGIKPIPKTVRKLIEKPSDNLKHSRLRNKRLDQIARYWKYKSWSDYETTVIRDFLENGSEFGFPGFAE